MKYLVNRETKEHRIYEDAEGKKHYLPAEEKPNNYHWMFVEADEEGWIKWEGGECPLPENAAVSVKFAGCSISARHPAGYWSWACRSGNGAIVAYRPILDKPDKEFLEACNNSAGAQYAEDYNAAIDSVLERAIEEAAASEVRLPTLLDRLKAAHEAAQRIPDLEAELREVLWAMGYDLVARSPFVERTDSESGAVDTEGGTETPQDMSDWRNWESGDIVMLKEGVSNGIILEQGVSYEIVATDPTGFWIRGGKADGLGISGRVNDFRFHSRPEVKS